MESSDLTAVWPFGTSEMAEQIRGFDWSKTPLGSIADWTERCNSIVEMVLASGFPTIALIGPTLIQIYNDGYRAYMGGKHPHGLGQSTYECWPEVRHIDGPIFERVFAGETVTLEDDHRVLLRNGAPEDAWFTLSYSPLRDAAGTVTDILVTVFETTERVRAQNVIREHEMQLEVMVAELHHRTRNLIGLVGMMMRQLIVSSTSLDDFRVRFTERLDALSRAQSLLSLRSNDDISIGDIVRVELDALGADLESERVRIDGDAVPLRKSAVQTLSLAIHELATNARKYGALHGNVGKLIVRWEEYRTEASRRRLRFDWTETGIDPCIEETVGPMHRGGYGRRLIEEALPYTLKAKTAYTLGADRLDCSIDMPLDR